MECSQAWHTGHRMSYFLCPFDFLPTPCLPQSWLSPEIHGMKHFVKTCMPDQTNHISDSTNIGGRVYGLGWSIMSKQD